MHAHNNATCNTYTCYAHLDIYKHQYHMLSNAHKPGVTPITVCFYVIQWRHTCAISIQNVLWVLK